jgi:hypothetical protein
MFMGALLLLATVLTWGIGLMMSPHGETVARGTEHLRATIVTFKRNGAIGTLVLCALAAWLLFPRRRPKWPERDWALAVLIAFLAGSSIYTLIWLPPSARTNFKNDENLAASNMDLDWNVVGPPTDLQATNFASDVGPVVARRANIVSAGEANDPVQLNGGQTAQVNATEEEADTGVADAPAEVEGNADSISGAGEPADDETDENQE